MYATQLQELIMKGFGSKHSNLLFTSLPLSVATTRDSARPHLLPRIIFLHLQMHSERKTKKEARVGGGTGSRVGGSERQEEERKKEGDRRGRG